jgi:type I restriction enzyme, S subunit
MDERLEGWEFASLGEVTRNFDGQRIPVKAEDRAKRRGPYPYYGASGVIDQIDDFLFDGEYLLIGEDGANLLSRSTPLAYKVVGKFWVNNHAHILQTRSSIPLDYLELFINCFDLQEYVTGSAQPKLTQQALNRIPVPIPPLAEQRRIVSAIERILDKVSSARARLERVPRTLKRFRQAVLAAACSGRLTEDWRATNSVAETAWELLDRIRQQRRVRWEANGHRKKYVEPELGNGSELPELPSGWCWLSAAEVVEQGSDIRYGIVQPGPNLNDGVPYVRGIDIQDGAILVNQLWKTSREIAHQYRNSALSEGDVLLGIIRHLKVAVVPKSLDGGNMSRTTARLRPSVLVSSEYLARCLESPQCQSWLKLNYRGGTDMPKVNIEDVVRLPIPLAPTDEQQEIVRRVSALFARADAIEARATAALKRVESLTQAVLAKAFRGELVPTEAELARRENRTYEPASELLARIRATAATPTKAKRPRKSPK